MIRARSPDIRWDRDIVANNEKHRPKMLPRVAFLWRCKCAWLVFTGRCDVLAWRNGYSHPMLKELHHATSIEINLCQAK